MNAPMRLIGAGAACLDAEIRNAVSNHHPLDLATLRAAWDAEAASPGPRVTIIRLLEREIRRQERAK